MAESKEHERLTEEEIRDWFRDVDAPAAAEYAQPGREVHHVPPLIELIEEFLKENGTALKDLKGHATRNSLERFRNGFIAFMLRKRARYVPLTPAEHHVITGRQAKARTARKQLERDAKK